jgi:hypothetical protein
MRTLANLLALALVLALTTIVAGWWTIPIVSGLWTLAAPRRAAVLYAVAAGAIAWGALLLWTARAGPVGAVDTLLAQMLHIPPRALIGLTMLYASLLSGAAALVAQAIRPVNRIIDHSIARSVD